MVSTCTTNTINSFYNYLTCIILTLITYITIPIKVEQNIIYTNSKSTYTTISTFACNISYYILFITIGSIYFSSIYKGIATFWVLVSWQREVLIFRSRIIRVINSLNISRTSYLLAQITTYSYVAWINTCWTFIKIYIYTSIFIFSFKPI